MASTRPNPYGMATPLGEGLSSVFNAFLSAPSPEDRAASALKIHGMQAQGKRDLAAAGYDDTRTEQLRGELDANSSLADLFAQPNYDPIKANSMAVGGGIDPTKANQMLLNRQALTPNVNMRDMDPLVFAKGGNAGNTFTGFREDQGRQFAQNEADNVTTARGQDLTHSASIYNTDQTQAGHDRRFTVDAAPGHKVFAAPGNPIGPTEFDGPPKPVEQGMSLSVDDDGNVTFSQGGGANVPSKVVSDNLTAQDALGSYARTSGIVRNIAMSDPKIFGTMGNARRLFQAVAAQAEMAVPMITGGDPVAIQDADAVFDAVRADLAQVGVADPQVYDPNLTDIDKMSILLAYKAAGAIAAQEGRGLSNEDFQKFRTIVGDPTAWGASQGSFIAGINRLDQVALGEANAKRQQMGQPPITMEQFLGDAASPAAPQNGNELQEAQTAIARGADRRAVAQRYKQRTGQDLP